MGMCMELVAHNLRASSRGLGTCSPKKYSHREWRGTMAHTCKHQMHKCSKNNSLTII